MVDRSVKEAYYNDRMKQSAYQKYKQEAETSKTLFENMWKVIGCGVNRSQYNSAPADTKAEVRSLLKSKEPKVPGDLESWAVSEAEIDKICNRYIDEFITPMRQISEQMETSIDILGSKNLMINNLSFDKKIKELQDALNKEIDRMQAFIDAVSERAYLVHMIQYYHLIDYYRYYGNYNNFESSKTWDRSSEGID